MIKSYYKVECHKFSELLINTNNRQLDHEVIEHGIVIERTFNTSLEISDYLDHFSWNGKPHIKDDIITIKQMETMHDYEATDLEKHKHELGEIDLYNCMYCFSITKVVETELTSDEDLELIGGGK